LVSLGKGMIYNRQVNMHLVELLRARWFWYAPVLGLFIGSGYALGMRGDQLWSLGIFAAAIGGSLLYWERRLLFVFVGVGLLMAAGLLTVEGFVQAAGLDIVAFLLGMMLVIGYLEENWFFDRIIRALVDMAGPRPLLVVTILLAASFVLSALVNEVTSIVILLAALFHLTDRLEVRPWPFIMALVFATNIGSAATVVGNPVGMMIALRSGLGFIDFLRWASPLALAAFLVLAAVLFWKLQGPLKELKVAMEVTTVRVQDPPGLFAPDMRLPWVIFGATMVALALHSPLEHALGLQKNSMLLAVALVGGGVSLLLAGPRARELLERRVEWSALVFFLLLFASVGTLKTTGAMSVLTERVREWSRDDPTALLFLLSGIAGFITALMDNVLAVATFIPVVQALEGEGLGVLPLWWGLLFGATILGNLTVIGSTANIVAAGMWERRGGKVRPWEWLKLGFWASLPPWALAMGLLYLRVQLT